MTDVVKLPNIGWVLQKRAVSVDRWLEEHQILTPGDLRKVCEDLKDQYDFPEEWVRAAAVMCLERMMTLPISIGYTSPPVVPILPAVEEESNQPLVQEVVEEDSPPVKAKKGTKKTMKPDKEEDPAGEDPLPSGHDDSIP